jgi:hypothetical protein
MFEQIRMRIDQTAAAAARELLIGDRQHRSIGPIMHDVYAARSRNLF